MDGEIERRIAAAKKRDRLANMCGLCGGLLIVVGIATMDWRWGLIAGGAGILSWAIGSILAVR